MAIQQVDLVGDNRPVVTPSATAAMSEAVRNGTISILDVMDRVDARTRKKQELELVTAQQGIADAQDPQLVEAKRSQQLLAGDQAQQTRDLLPLARRAAEEKLFGDINSGQIQRYGLKEKLAALNEVGFAPAPDPQKGITPEFAAEVNKNFSALLRWQKDKADAKFELANIKDGEIITDQGTFQGPTDVQTGAPIVPGKVEGIRARAAKTLPEFLRDAPPGGIVSTSPIVAQALGPAAQAASPVAQPAIVISPAEAAQGRAQLINQNVPNAGSMGDQEVAALVRPRAAAPTAVLPVIQPAQAAAIPPGFIQVKPAPAVKVPEIVRPTEGQQRALLAVPRFQEANAALQDLQAKGYDPTSWGSWVASYMPQIFKSGDRKELETAMSAWSQGLLRLESGAAITPKEEGWYVQTFFPAVSDPPTVVAQKAALRAGVEAMVSEVGTAGEIPEDIKLRVRNLRNSLPGGAVTTPTAATVPAIPATPSALPIVSDMTQYGALPSGTTFRTPDGDTLTKP